MPELPEVETTLRGLSPVLQDRRLTRVEARRKDLRRPIPLDLNQRLTGATVIRVGRRAKYGLIGTDRGDTLIFHLGMSGRWRIDPDEIGKHDHLLLETDAGHRLTLNDPRRFGSIDLVPTADLSNFSAFSTLGPEPLSPDLSTSYLEARFSQRVAPIKSLLLDQRTIAGLGNIYVCEALNLARINPRRAAGAVQHAELKRLVAAIPSVLLAAIDAGGSTLRDYAQPDGQLGYFSKQFRVYGREGKPCPYDSTLIQRQIDGGRSTFWCPTCQR
jgi:formamidopyrimidine-DNA glycosylase